MHQAADNQKCGNTLGNHGCQRDTRYVHLELGNKEYVQCCIDNTCHGQEIQRTFRIADRAQDRTSEVVHHRCRHTGSQKREVNKPKKTRNSPLIRLTVIAVWIVSLMSRSFFAP